MLTCAHVLSGPDLTTTFPVAPWKGSYEAEVLFVNTRRDVAILRAKGLRNDRWANVRLHGATNAGEAILAVGNPSMGIGGTNAGGVASGIISNPLLELDGGQYLSADVSIASGSSGGPLFSLKDGALVGLVQFVATAPGLAKDEAGVSSTGFLALAAPAHFLGEWLGLKLTPAK